MLKLNDVAFQYRAHPVLENISFEIEKNQIYGLVGRNGSGKSTLFKIILGLLQPQGGKINFEGQDLHALSRIEQARAVSLLEAGVRPVFSMKVHELLELGVKNLKRTDALETQAQLKTAFDLSSLWNRDTLSLSTGELQRCLLAHTLAAKSQLTMLDEPFSHQDWDQQFKLVQILRNWSQQHGLTFFISMHELGWLPSLCTKVVVLGQRKILAHGPIESTLGAEVVRREFDFSIRFEDNPIDGSRQIILGKS